MNLSTKLNESTAGAASRQSLGLEMCGTRNNLFLSLVFQYNWIVFQKT